MSDLSIIMSPRTSIIWAQNVDIFNDIDIAFKLTFLIDAMKMTKKSLTNFIKGVLGEILSKKQKNDLFINQKIVANSISKNKKKIFRNKTDDIDTKNEQILEKLLIVF